MNPFINFVEKKANVGKEALIRLYPPDYSARKDSEEGAVAFTV